jgi:predicted O-linked N-acetylglucosamine transferase (SPINDLY family)
MPDWIGEDVAQYVSIATTAASDVQHLARRRTELRSRMEQSPLMDARRFAADIETAYRDIWREWCQRQRQ